MDSAIKAFISGVHNLIDAENIPKDAAQDSSNFVTVDGKIVLVGGRTNVGTEGVYGKITGQHFGYKVDGSQVHFAKFGTVLKYWDGSAWQDCITGLTENQEMSFANYSSLAGAFVYVNSPDGFWKIITANPGSPINVYNSAKNFKGYILIDKGRCILWNRDKDKTGLYGSYIDKQNSTVYTAVTSEAIGALGSTVYSGTLAFKAGGTTRSCFGISISGNTGAGTETFTDNGLRVLTSDKGGTGTINYATGVYSVTFNAITTGAVTGNYSWEDVTSKGLADFTKSATRLAGEGFQFPQDEGGDPILTVLVGQDGAYYSLKAHSTYRLMLEATDLNATNEVFRKDIGVPNWRASMVTEKGIIFINTSNPTKPIMTILQKNAVGDTVEPVQLFQHFKFENYDYSNAYFASFDRWVMVLCKKSGNASNDTILMCNYAAKTIDIVRYNCSTAAQSNGKLYIGDSLSKSIYQIFTGYDDMGQIIDAYWTGKDELYNAERLKKFRKLRFSGNIDPDQTVEVHVSYDGSGFSQVGTILGKGPYVNYQSPATVGGPLVGQGQIGGDDIAESYPYFMEIKVKTPKFRQRAIKFVPKGIGYFDLNSSLDFDILTFENRLPKLYREKQNVSIDGKTNNLDNPQ